MTRASVVRTTTYVTTIMTMNTLRRTLALFTCIVAATACQRSDPAKELRADAATDAAHASLAQLPDWSGAWVGGPGLSVQDFGFFENNFRFNANDDSTVGRVPLNAKYKKLLATNIAQNGGSGLSGTRLAKCLPAGMPGIMDHGTAFEFLFTPGRVTMLIEDGEVRRIFTDGRPHPKREEMQDSVLGHSIGHWEGDTLVVDTINMLPQAELFFDSGLQVTANTHISERIFRKDARTLQIDFVVTDPDVFTQPYTYTRLYDHSDFETFEVQCAANNRDTVDAVDLTPPSADDSGSQS